MAAAPAVIWDVVEEHLSEAAFLWEQWQRVMASPCHTVAEVAAGTEERLLAHLAGLSLEAPGIAEQILVPALAEDEGKAFAAAAALVATGNLGALREALPEGAGPASAARRAVTLVLRPEQERQVAGWLDGASDAARAVAVEALAARRALPSAALDRFLGSSDPRLAAAALRAAADAGDAYRGAVEAAMSSDVPVVRDAGVVSGLRMGLQAALAALRRHADAGGSDAILALELLALAGDAGDVDRIAAALRDPALRPAALWAAGLSGWPGAGDLCLPFLEDARLERLSFEAISALGGAEVARLARPEAPAESGIEDAIDLEPLPWPEEELPLPDAELVASVWRRARARLGEARCIAGRPRDADGLLRAFTSGPTRPRRALGLELFLRSRGEYRVDVDAWAGDQLRAQAASRLTARADFGQAVSRLLRP